MGNCGSNFADGLQLLMKIHKTLYMQIANNTQCVHESRIMAVMLSRCSINLWKCFRADDAFAIWKNLNLENCKAIKPMKHLPKLIHRLNLFAIQNVFIATVLKFLEAELGICRWHSFWNHLIALRFQFSTLALNAIELNLLNDDYEFMMWFEWAIDSYETSIQL